jgi:DNA-binding NarL/FixJ family response regulator
VRRRIRVFVVDDHEMIRRGLRELIAAEKDLEMAGEADRMQGALDLIRQSAPHIVVVDLKLPDGDGVELCREVRSELPDVRCLIFTSYVDEAAIFEAVMAGSSGFLLKSSSGQDLVGALHAAAAGHSLLDPALTQNLMQMMRRRSEEPGRGLTAQERRVLELVGQGLTNRQIAATLRLAEKTVRNYVTKLLGKLGLEHRAQAALYAARQREEDSGLARWN